MVEPGDAEQRRIAARERLAASDAIIRGNLIPSLRRENAAGAEFERLVSASPGAGRVTVIAHRGDSENFPENTLAAIEGAAALGCDFAEIDVRLDPGRRSGDHA